MPGKYEKILPDLPRYEGPDRSYNDKVNERKAEILVDREILDDDQTFATAKAEYEKGLAFLLSANRKLTLGLAGRHHANVMARYYRELRVMKDAMYQQEYDVNLTIAAYEAILVDQYENEGTSSLRLKEGGSVGVQWEPYSQVLDRDAHRKWAMENGLERSLQLPWQTTNAVTKQRLMDGLTPPDGVTATAKPKVVLRKA